MLWGSDPVLLRIQVYYVDLLVNSATEVGVLRDGRLVIFAQLGLLGRNLDFHSRDAVLILADVGVGGTAICEKGGWVCFLKVKTKFVLKNKYMR